MKQAAKLRFGGYGNFGPPGRILGAGVFHWGTNTVDSADKKLARFSMSKPSKDQPREALPAAFDSGSPIFHADGGEILLAGIAIRVTNRVAPGIGDRAVMTCVAGQEQWIKRIAPEVSWRKSE